MKFFFFNQNSISFIFVRKNSIFFYEDMNVQMIERKDIVQIIKFIVNNKIYKEDIQSIL